MSDIKDIFSTEQLVRIGAALSTEARRAKAQRYLYEKWRIQLSNFIHDEWILDVPDSLTKEDGDVIFAELMTLVE